MDIMTDDIPPERAQALFSLLAETANHSFWDHLHSPAYLADLLMSTLKRSRIESFHLDWPAPWHEQQHQQHEGHEDEAFALPCQRFSLLNNMDSMTPYPLHMV